MSKVKEQETYLRHEGIDVMSDAKMDSIRSSRENVRAVKEDLDDIRGAVRRGDFGVERRDAEIAAARTVIDAVNAPAELRDNLALFLRLVRKVLGEYDEDLRRSFDTLLVNAIAAGPDDASARIEELRVSEKGSPAGFVASIAAAIDSARTADAEKRSLNSFLQFVSKIDDLSVEKSTLLMRAFVTYFHLANLCEENYRVQSLRAREAAVPTTAADNPINDITVAYRQLIEECGEETARLCLKRLEFHPVFTAHPTEARRKTIEKRIRTISELLDERAQLGGIARLENERRMLEEIDALFRTSPIAHKKPTPIEEADTILNLFDTTLFEMIPSVYRRFDDWELGDAAGTVPPVCPPFFHPGSWIGSDRDGNPNVTARVSRKVAEKYRVHVLDALARATHDISRSLTLDGISTPPSDELTQLWSHQTEMSETLSSHAFDKAGSELHRATMRVISDRLNATIKRNSDLMYQNAEEYIADLRIVQDSLAKAGAVRAAYGPMQKIIWQAQTFGFHLVEMEFRQHSLVHTRALEDILEHGRAGEKGELDHMTHEVMDTFRAIGSIQRKNGINAARRYIISFTRSAEDVENVYKLARLSFSHEEDAPVLDVIPLFEQIEDLENAVTIMEKVIQLPDVQRRLAQTGRRLEVMLGYSDSSKDAGPTSATLVLHAAQAALAEWAEKNDIDLVLMHGRGGAVGRGGGPANRAVLSQPKGSVNCRFKLTEQGEVIFARYGDPTLACRHVESVAGATLLQSAPSVEHVNTDMTIKYASLAKELDQASQKRFHTLLDTKGFAEWFSVVTPLTEIGLLPIGSRPAKRGLGAKSLDDLRAIPWIFSWSQARINLAAWYGLGTACEAIGDLGRLRAAYKEWPLFTTFIDNIEMSLAKVDTRIARLYLSLGDQAELSEMVLSEMALTRKWVLAITGNKWPLENRRVLGPVIRLRLPFVNVLSVTQVHALSELRIHKESLTPEERERFIYLILCTVSGVAAGLQNTG